MHPLHLGSAKMLKTELLHGLLVAEMAGILRLPKRTAFRLGRFFHAIVLHERKFEGDSTIPLNVPR